MKREPGLAERVARIVARIPRGKVATYGQVASLCGSPRAARQVGWILHHSYRQLPWQRVINREGRLSIAHPFLTPAHQAVLLRKEGVRVSKRAGAFWVDLAKYLWNPKSPDRGTKSRRV